MRPLPPTIASRRGLTLLEVVMATMIMAAVAVPLFELFGSGIRSTHATIHETLGTNLAAELAEQLESLPFDTLGILVPTGEITYASDKGTLANGTAVGESRYSFHLSPLPKGFQRSLTLTRSGERILFADVLVSWKIGTLPPRELRLRRAFARDSLLP